MKIGLKTALAVALCSASVATGARAAAVYDPAAQGTAPTNFTYGFFDPRAGGTLLLQPFTNTYTAASGDCFGTVGVSCVKAPGESPYLGAYFVSSDQSANSAYLHASDVTLHPGANGELAAVAFIAPSAGTYNFSGLFRAVDSPYGNGTDTGHSGSTVTTPIGGTYLAPGGSYTFNFNQPLSAGDRVSFYVGPAGGYGYDTTGLVLAVSAVPEPSTWALMLFGFGAVGYTMRSRRKLAYRTAQAV